ncbi:MAG: exodeoxyribonuclease VII large subunit [Alphaproteobacteria bacterium]
MPETALDFNHNQPVYSISEISLSIKRVLEDHFGLIRLRGEVSGWRGAHSSGHAYFSLKDDKSVINAVCWKGTLSKLQHKPEEGLEVIATGRISAFNGKYQLVVEHIEPAGAGALMALLEKRKKMLEAEGLFAPGRKKKLPYLPRVVGVVTSPTGAVIRDILHRISDRFPVHVLVWPVAVQGEGAAEQIAAAIKGFNSLPPTLTLPHKGGGDIVRPDVLIVARGGGSIEDLWAFNEEIVARAAAASAIPLISAVGHETDTTLIDFVSDQRAPTPTAAAEMAVPVLSELKLLVNQLDGRLLTSISAYLSRIQEKLAGLTRGLPRPAQLLEHAMQRLDMTSERLQAALPTFLLRTEQKLAVLAASLKPQTLVAALQQFSVRLPEYQQRMQQAISRNLNQREEKLKHLAAMLESVNYKKVLERGFALVRDDAGKLINSTTKAKATKSLTLTFHDGDVKVTN